MARSIMLRGGWSTTDRRLDAIPEFDARSRRYPVSEVLTNKQRGLRSFGDGECCVPIGRSPRPDRAFLALTRRRR
jgi:hypothetical protein